MVAAEHYLKPEVNLQEFLDDHIAVKQLRANGFHGARFLLLQYRINNKGDNIPDSLYKKNEVYYSCDYIVVAYGGLIFRLKGFLNNDFYNFIEEFSETSDIGYLLKKNVLSIKNIGGFKAKIQSANIYIEDLDMECLYGYYQAQNNAMSKIKNVSCLGSCTIKDRKRPYQLK